MVSALVTKPCDFLVYEVLNLLPFGGHDKTTYNLIWIYLLIKSEVGCSEKVHYEFHAFAKGNASLLFSSLKRKCLFSVGIFL